MLFLRSERPRDHRLDNKAAHVHCFNINRIWRCPELPIHYTHREWLLPIFSFVRERMRILVERAIALGAERESYLFDVARFRIHQAKSAPNLLYSRFVLRQTDKGVWF
ncbi:hypothetical protein ACFOGG_06630 [Brenneria rubrifaciens]|uniref:hypothetical protein n=1 Tax=Brenneria rubrifaciens TaxID=55213 RepID=UPI0026ABCA3B